MLNFIYKSRPWATSAYRRKFANSCFKQILCPLPGILILPVRWKLHLISKTRQGFLHADLDYMHNLMIPSLVPDSSDQN